VRPVDLLYFAWVRERIGLSDERLIPPPEVTTVGALLALLAARGGGYAEALADRAAVHVAVNQVLADDATAIAAGDEIALFPPVTGG